MKKFLDVKTLVTLSVTVTFVALTLTDRLDPKDFMTVAVMIFTYYFNRKESNGDSND